VRADGRTPACVELSSSATPRSPLPGKWTLFFSGTNPPGRPSTNVLPPAWAAVIDWIKRRLSRAGLPSINRAAFARFATQRFRRAPLLRRLAFLLRLEDGRKQDFVDHEVSFLKLGGAGEPRAGGGRSGLLAEPPSGCARRHWLPGPDGVGVEPSRITMESVMSRQRGSLPHGTGQSAGPSHRTGGRLLARNQLKHGSWVLKLMNENTAPQPSE
jgi:hypothetical protein